MRYFGDTKKCPPLLVMLMCDRVGGRFFRRATERKHYCVRKIGKISKLFILTNVFLGIMSCSIINSCPITDSQLFYKQKIVVEGATYLKKKNIPPYDKRYLFMVRTRINELIEKNISNDKWFSRSWCFDVFSDKKSCQKK